jgi:hypothetical protein
VALLAKVHLILTSRPRFATNLPGPFFYLPGTPIIECQPDYPRNQSPPGLTIPERLLLFCLASNTDWQAASITHATAQHMMVRGLIERHCGSAPDAVPACPLCEEHLPRLWKSGAAACDPDRKSHPPGSILAPSFN